MFFVDEISGEFVIVRSILFVDFPPSFIQKIVLFRLYFAAYTHDEGPVTAHNNSFLNYCEFFFYQILICKTIL
jgi:hypothetical protein